MGRGPVYKSRIVNPPKKWAVGPLLRVDPVVRVTRYFCMAEGKGIAPSAGTTLHRGQPVRVSMKDEAVGTAIGSGGPWGT